MMKRFFITLLLLSLLAGICLILYDAFFRPPKNDNELILYGNVDVRQVDISFRVSGLVESLLFEEGDFVKKGSLVATLDKSPYDRQKSQAKANLETLKVTMKNAEILLKRRLELIGDGSVSQEDVDNARSTFEQLQAEVNASDAAFLIANDNLDYTKTYSPSDGIILTRIREPGSVVRETDPVYTLSIASPVWIRAFVDETHLGKVDYGMDAEISTDNPNGHPYAAKVGYISPMAEFTPKSVETTQLRTDLVYRLRLYIDKPDAALKQGMPVTVKLKSKKDDTVNKE